MEFTLLGMLIEIKPLHILESITADEGHLLLGNSYGGQGQLQPEKAFLPIAVIPSGMVTEESEYRNLRMQNY